MSVVLLRWNPDISSYRMDDFKKAMDEARETQEYYMNWSVWEHEKVHRGDRFFLLRVGKGKTGIAMSGRITSEPYRSEDWSGKGRETYYVDLVPDFLVDTDRAPRLSVTDLEKAFPKYIWKEGHSGMVLDENLGTKLEWLWLKFLYDNYMVNHKKNFASNLYETDKDSVLYTYYGGKVKEPIQLDLAHRKGIVCEICGYDYDKIFDMDAIGYVSVQNIYYMFPAARLPKSPRSLFHCICANCRNIYRDLCDDTNGGALLPFDCLLKAKRK